MPTAAVSFPRDVLGLRAASTAFIGGAVAWSSDFNGIRQSVRVAVIGRDTGHVVREVEYDTPLIKACEIVGPQLAEFLGQCDRTIGAGCPVHGLQDSAFDHP
jgi:hypothetical protein